MTMITLKINERTKAGKALLSMLDFFIKESKGPYGPEFVAMVKKSVDSKKRNRLILMMYGEV
ncbi:DUF2683 family protein [uncultured Flavobacterium sp.]|uniref:DUF2683 family protein n=1 Tax=uncultured Flavobacterium sp. TaxID=165435 RepID=UPI0025F6097F|nr:DUF2683 family protein [uncultured Flavobacterium sp.]